MLKNLPGLAVARAQRFGQLLKLISPGDALRFLRREDEKNELTVRIFGHDVVLRGGTSDIALFFDTFVAGALELPFTIPPPKIIVDAGGHVGFAALHFANRFPDAAITTLEPAPDNFAMLRRNCAGIRRIDPVQAALWPQDGTVVLSDTMDGEPWSYTVGRSDRKMIGMVDAISMPTLLRRVGGTIDILKIDIEGAEERLFSADTGWLDSVRILVVELHDRYGAGCARALYRALAKFDFRQDIRNVNVFIKLR